MKKRQPKASVVSEFTLCKGSGSVRRDCAHLPYLSKRWVVPKQQQVACRDHCSGGRPLNGWSYQLGPQLYGWSSLPMRRSGAVDIPFLWMASCAVVKDVLTCSARWVQSRCFFRAWGWSRMWLSCLKALQLKTKKHYAEAIAFRNGVALLANKDARIWENQPIFQRLKGGRNLLLWNPSRASCSQRLKPSFLPEWDHSGKGITGAVAYL